MKAFLSVLLLTLLTVAGAQAQRSAPSGGGNSGTSGKSNPTNPNQKDPNDPNQETNSNVRYWQAMFANGGHYMVRLDHIACASKQIYISDGAARVVEVNIGADAAIVARFYFLEPVGKDTPIAAGQVIMDRAQDLIKTVASKTSPSAGQLQVVKNYPLSTHAHTVEFVVQDEATLNSLYTSLMAAISTGQGRTWNEAGGDSANSSNGNNSNGSGSGGSGSGAVPGTGN